PIFDVKPGELYGAIAKYVVNRIPPLPDEVALPIMEEAFSWVEYKGKDVLALQDIYFDNLRRNSCSTNDSPAKLKCLAKEISEFEFSLSPKLGIPWREPIIGEEVIRPDLGEAFWAPTQVLRNLLFRVRDAAIICLHSLVGIRVSEVCSIKSGHGKEGLPRCVTKKISKSGALELFFLEGILSKGVAVPRAEEWLLGCRPAGSTELPITVKAIQLVEKLWAPWRKLGETDYLFLTFSQPKSLPRVKTGVVQLASGVLSEYLKQFIYYEVDLSNLPDKNEIGEELGRYRNSRGYCIRPHQWRKTFAAYVLESRASLLPAVRQHFKHVSDAMTESAYFPAVMRLRQESDSFRAALTVDFFNEFIDGKPLVGGMAELMGKWFDESFRKMGRSEREKALANLVFVHDLRIFFSDHGNCLIRANPLASRCRTATDSQAWSSVSPDFNVRTPSMCSGCGCFVLDVTHLPFWKTRKNECENSLREVKERNRSEFHVIQKRKDQAEKVIQMIDRRNNAKGN
ncbi:hypothetical protein, partial [Comamonas sp.]|uniref:hypothetical protein n=1 Tax=Comamonas sp. TaxID=34028 RepID=UPI0026487178